MRRGLDGCGQSGRSGGLRLAAHGGRGGRPGRWIAQWNVVLLVVALATVMAGCALPFGGSGGTRATAKMKAPDQQQILYDVVTGAGDAKTLDPAFALDQNTQVVLPLLWPTLVTFDHTLTPQPWAARSFEVSADGLVYTFHLRSGMTFSDGTPLDANAFAYALNRLVDPCVGSQGWFYLATLKDAITFNGEGCVNGSYSALAGQTAPVISTLIGDAIGVGDPQTLTLKLQKPAAFFLSALAYPATAALPKALIERYHEQWTQHLVDSGFGGSLFTLTKWTHGAQSSSMTLTRNARFWGTKPVLRTLVMTWYQTDTAEYADWSHGKNDVGVAPVSVYETAKKEPTFGEAPQLTEDYYGVNWRTPPFDDLRMRQAFALALDKGALARQALLGTAAPTNHIVPQGMPGYNTRLTGVDGSTSVAGNVAQATQLAQAYAKEHCGGALSACPAVTLTVSADNAIAQNEATAALQMWRSALPGYKISVKTLDPSSFVTALGSNVNGAAMQLWAAYWTADYPDPEDWLSLQFLPGSPYNSGNVNVKEATPLLQRADGTTAALAQRITDYQQAEQALVTQVAWIPLDQTKQWWQTRAYVQGYMEAAIGAPTLDTWQRVTILTH